MIGSPSDQFTPIKKTAKIQLISLVAVVFLLFAAFAMYAGTLEKKASITLDSGSSCGCGGWGSHVEQAVLLQVTDAGLYWNKELITQRELPTVLAKYVAQSKNPRIVLAGDDRSRYGQTIDTLDEIRKAGITQVTVESVYRPTGQ
jgi:biopolymer transport protein ExbD